jgi:hypothetical protein
MMVHTIRFNRLLKRVLLSATLPSFSGIFCKMPGIAPRTEVGAKVLGRLRRRDLVRGCGESLALRCVLALPADRTF